MRTGQVTIAFLMIGVALRLRAYLANSSLALDEVLLSRNILDLPLGDLLTKPLHLDQVAPRGFLLVEKTAVTLFGHNELALRLFPFLCGIAALFLFQRLAVRALDGWGPSIAVGLFAIGVPFLKYSAEVKQYGVDAAAAIALMLVALDLRDRDAPMRTLLLAGTAGLVVIWFSQASVLVMAGIGVATAIEWLIARDRRTWRMLMVTIPMWAVACGVAVIAGVRSMTPATREFMQDFWGTGFLPLPLQSSADLRWFWDRLPGIFSDVALLRYRWPVLFALAAVAGLAALGARRRTAALVIAGPIVVVFAAAVAQQYPFRGRLLLFALPAVLIAVAAAGEWLRARAARLHPALGLAAIVALFIAPVEALVQAPPPYEIEHHRAMLAHLQRNRQPGDIIHVFPLSAVGTQFYGPQFGLQLDHWTTAACDRNDTRAYLLDVDRYRGAKRVWILASGARAFRSARSAVQKYLETIGVKRYSLYSPSPTLGTVGVELYDLSDPVRLAAANAATFPVQPMPTDPRPGCRPWTKHGGVTRLIPRPSE